MWRRDMVPMSGKRGVFAALGVLAVLGSTSVAVLGDDASCAGRCLPGTDGSKPCQCNSHCEKYNDCCQDYMTQCVSTCNGRCGSSLDNTRPCQCNSQCEQYGDCCHDYQSLCADEGTTEKCDALADVTEYFWSNDVNRMTSSSDFTVDWQAQVPNGNSADQSPNKLFSWLDESVFNAKPTFGAFVSLLNNYDCFIGTSDFVSDGEKAEIDQFFSLINATAIFGKLYEFLKCKGHVNSQSDFQSKFYELWFNLYGRSSSASAILDSSGFEHVMVGELRVSGGSESVSGFHSWVQFYQEEKLGRINYYGFVKGVQNAPPNVIGANFAWRPACSSRDAVKSMGSFFIGSSPEFDLALYTLCVFEFPNAICDVQVGGGASLRIQTWDVGHESGLQIGSAFPSI